MAFLVSAAVGRHSRGADADAGEDADPISIGLMDRF